LKLYLASFRFRHRSYPDSSRMGDIEYRIVQAPDEKSAAEKLVRAVQVDDPHGFSKDVEKLELSEAIV